MLQLNTIPILFQSLSDIILANVEHGLSIFATSLLQTPGSGVIEVDSSSTRTVIEFLEVLSEGDIWKGSELFVNLTTTCIVVLN